ncbi:MAG TPA: VOC family protein [Kofleriaceae bacterium]|nr:VOC family protein [Kofleriaceae bacterium]
MPKKKPAKKPTKKPTKKPAPAKTAAPVPALFRINIEVGDVEQAAKDWGTLLGLGGRPQAGSRVYFTTGAVTLQVVQLESPHPAAKALYFLVDELEPVHARAKALGWLSKDLVHGQPGGDISVRPWGERSFYVEDTWGNPLCFVQTGTTYPG